MFCYWLWSVSLMIDISLRERHCGERRVQQAGAAHVERDPVLRQSHRALPLLCSSSCFTSPVASSSGFPLSLLVSLFWCLFSSCVSWPLLCWCFLLWFPFMFMMSTQILSAIQSLGSDALARLRSPMKEEIQVLLVLLVSHCHSHLSHLFLLSHPLFRIYSFLSFMLSLSPFSHLCCRSLLSLIYVVALSSLMISSLSPSLIDAVILLGRRHCLECPSGLFDALEHYL